MKKKTQDILNILNGGPTGPWIVVNGAHAITTVTKNEVNTVNFNPASGLLVKAFYNQETGEIKLYPALMFEDAF